MCFYLKSKKFLDIMLGFGECFLLKIKKNVGFKLRWVLKIVCWYDIRYDKYLLVC